MKRVFASVLAVMIVAGALAWSAPNSKWLGGLRIEVRDKNPWTSLELNNRPENFQFAIVTDRTGGHRQGVFQSAVGKINLLQPEFVMSVGDLIEGGTEDRARLDAEWKEFNGFIEQLEMPFFYVPGNHDITNQAMIPVWQEQFDRTWFHFVYHDVLFVCLNSEDPPGHTVEIESANGNVRKVKAGNLGDEQLAWLSGVLQRNTDVRWTVIFVHKPMWQHGEHTNWTRVEEMLGDRKRTVFAGHHHRYRKHVNGEHTYYALATTGGASRLGGPADGQFDHIVWVTMTPDGPRLANLMLDGIWTADPVAEAQAQRDAAKSAENQKPAGQ